jgi:hypothetical protein
MPYPMKPIKGDKPMKVKLLDEPNRNSPKVRKALNKTAIKGMKNLQHTLEHGGRAKKKSKKKDDNGDNHVVKEYTPSLAYVQLGDSVKFYDERNELKDNYIVSLIPQIRSYDKVIKKNGKPDIVETAFNIVCLINRVSGTTWHTPVLTAKQWNRVAVFHIPLSLLLGPDMVIKPHEYDSLEEVWVKSYAVASESSGITRVSVRSAIR